MAAGKRSRALYALLEERISQFRTVEGLKRFVAPESPIAVDKVIPEDHELRTSDDFAGIPWSYQEIVHLSSEPDIPGGGWWVEFGVVALPRRRRLYVRRGEYQGDELIAATAGAATPMADRRFLLHLFDRNGADLGTHVAADVPGSIRTSYLRSWAFLVHIAQALLDQVDGWDSVLERMGNEAWNEEYENPRGYCQNVEPSLRKRLEAEADAKVAARWGRRPTSLGTGGGVFRDEVDALVSKALRRYELPKFRGARARERRWEDDKQRITGRYLEKVLSF